MEVKGSYTHAFLSQNANAMANCTGMQFITALSVWLREEGIGAQDAHDWMGEYELLLQDNPGYRPTAEQTFLVIAICNGTFDALMDPNSTSTLRTKPSADVETQKHHSNRLKTVEQRGYKLLLTENHADVLWKALELLSRVHMGQLDRVVDEFIECDYGYSDKDMQTLRDIMEMGSHTVGCTSGSHRGIRACHERAKVAWDVMQVLRHQLSWDRNPDPDLEEMGVWHDRPNFVSGEKPHPQVEQITVTKPPPKE